MSQGYGYNNQGIKSDFLVFSQDDNEYFHPIQPLNNYHLIGTQGSLGPFNV